MVEMTNIACDVLTKWQMMHYLMLHLTVYGSDTFYFISESVS
jgi:hypothetical protein